jgi:EAL domain-containing protein (putative c-di-GMP-specific phosphodiesterase class I)
MAVLKPLLVFLDSLTGLQAADEFGEQLLRALSVPYYLKGYEVQSHASIGLALDMGEYDCAEDFIRDADLAMYRAKRGGGARQASFNITMRQSASQRLTLEQDLRLALDRNELFAVYQPVIELETGCLRGFEALVRWNHPTRGLLMPGEFIEIAEDSGLIIPLGKRMLEIVCRQIANWRERYSSFDRLSISVNLSQQHFNDPSLFGFLKSTLQAHKVPPKSLKIEMTESAIMSNLRAGKALMEQIATLGVDLHMDDFGTGYSSLHCLHDLRMQCLKIDRSFIVTLTLKRDYAAIISAIVQLAHNLGMQVVAEGVETREQMVMLQALECDRAQGYLISKPLPAELAETHFSNEIEVQMFPCADGGGKYLLLADPPAQALVAQPA